MSWNQFNENVYIYIMQLAFIQLSIFILKYINKAVDTKIWKYSEVSPFAGRETFVFFFLAVTQC